jgi:hypothetical protein
VHPEREGPFEPSEKGPDPGPLESKTLRLTREGVRIPVTSTFLELNDQGVKGDEIPGDGVFSALYADTRVDGNYAFRFLLRAVRDGRKGMITREAVRSAWVKPRLDPRSSKAHFVGSRYDERLDRTCLRFRLTPVDRHGNRIGPGSEDQVRDLVRAPHARITDNSDGTYGVEVMREGRVGSADVDRMEWYGGPGGRL